MSVNYTTVKWTEYETYGRKYELNVILAFTMRNWIYMLHQEDQEFKPTMHRIDTRTYELSRVDMECDDSFVKEFKKTEDHDDWSRKNPDREPVVHEDAVHIFTRMTATLYRGAFELDGVFYWRIVESTGDKPPSDEELEECYYLISSQPQSESDEDNSPSLYRQLYYENDDDHLIVMYQLDISTMEWTKRETNTSDKGGMDAIEYIEDYRELRTEATRIVRKSLLVGSKWHVLLSYTEKGMTLSAHLILDLQSHDLNWETRLSYRGDYRGLDFLAEVDHVNFFASTDRMFVSGEHTDTHRPMIYHWIFDIHEIAPRASVEPSHAADHVEGGYQYVVTIGTRHFFLGALGSTQIGRQRIVKSQLAVLETDSTQFNQRPLQEAGLLERDRTYDAVFPVLISLNVDSDNEEERENDEWNYSTKLSHSTLLKRLYTKMGGLKSCASTKLRNEMNELKEEIASLTDFKKTPSVPEIFHPEEEE